MEVKEVRDEMRHGDRMGDGTGGGVDRLHGPGGWFTETVKKKEE